MMMNRLQQKKIKESLGLLGLHVALIWKKKIDLSKLWLFSMIISLLKSKVQKYYFVDNLFHKLSSIYMYILFCTIFVCDNWCLEFALSDFIWNYAIKLFI